METNAILWFWKELDRKPKANGPKNAENLPRKDWKPKNFVPCSCGIICLIIALVHDWDAPMPKEAKQIAIKNNVFEVTNAAMLEKINTIVNVVIIIVFCPNMSAKAPKNQEAGNANNCTTNINVVISAIVIPIVNCANIATKANKVLNASL